MKKFDDSLSGNPLRKHVYKEIEKAILDGVFPPGYSLTEGKLSHELGVSRTPVREALMQLELEGLIELRPNRGALVIGITPGDIEDIYEIRSLLERRATEKAAAHINSEHIDRLREVVDLTEFYLERKDFDRVTAMDDRFHNLIYEMAGSRMFERILADLHAYAQTMRERSIKAPGRAVSMLAEHRAILDALVQKDSEKAGQLMAEHIQRSAENMEKNHLWEE